jgi:hypothetical protein
LAEIFLKGFFVLGQLAIRINMLQLKRSLLGCSLGKVLIRKAPLALLLLLSLISASSQASVYGQVRVQLQEKYRSSSCDNYNRKANEGSIFVLNDDATWAIVDLQTSYVSPNAGSYVGSYESRKITLYADAFREAFGMSLNTITNAICDFSTYENNRLDPLAFKLKINKRGDSVKISSKGKYSGNDVNTAKEKTGKWSISGKGTYDNTLFSNSSDLAGNLQKTNYTMDPSVYGLSLNGRIFTPEVSEDSSGSSGFIAFTTNGLFVFIKF